MRPISEFKFYDKMRNKKYLNKICVYIDECVLCVVILTFSSEKKTQQMQNENKETPSEHRLNTEKCRFVRCNRSLIH